MNKKRREREKKEFNDHSPKLSPCISSSSKVQPTRTGSRGSSLKFPLQRAVSFPAEREREKKKRKDQFHFFFILLFFRPFLPSSFSLSFLFPPSFSLFFHSPSPLSTPIRRGNTGLMGNRLVVFVRANIFEQQGDERDRVAYTQPPLFTIAEPARKLGYINILRRCRDTPPGVAKLQRVETRSRLSFLLSFFSSSSLFISLFLSFNDIHPVGT